MLCASCCVTIKGIYQRYGSRLGNALILGGKQKQIRNIQFLCNSDTKLFKSVGWKALCKTETYAEPARVVGICV